LADESHIVHRRALKEVEADISIGLRARLVFGPLDREIQRVLIGVWNIDRGVVVARRTDVYIDRRSHVAVVQVLARLVDDGVPEEQKVLVLAEAPGIDGLLYLNANRIALRDRRVARDLLVAAQIG